MTHPTIAIFIPTLNRAHNIPRVIKNIEENTNGDYTIYFICESSDFPSSETATRLGKKVIVNEGDPTYASCINAAYHKTDEQYFFSGADDLSFHPDWLPHALEWMGKGIDVVGTNDLGTIPVGETRDATHYLVRRAYIKKSSGVIDQPDTVLFNYCHNYTDKEFVETAKARGVYMYCPRSIVEHNHPVWGKGQMDETYRKGYRKNEQDRLLFTSRQHLWNEL